MSHHLTKNELQACRAFGRLLDVRTQGWDLAQYADSHWDGGEWSGPAWADNWQRAEAYCQEVIADRFNLPSAEYVMNLLWSYWGEQEYREVQAIMGRDPRPFPTDSWGEDIHAGCHSAACREYWDRGLECRCVPEDVKESIRQGARPEEVM